MSKSVCAVCGEELFDLNHDCSRKALINYLSNQMGKNQDLKNELFGLKEEIEEFREIVKEKNKIIKKMNNIINKIKLKRIELIVKGNENEKRS